MSSIYKRARSPYWWVKFKGPDGIKYESTHIRHGTKHAYHAAKVVALNKSVAEARCANSSGWDWVPAFLSMKPWHRTRTRYSGIWAHIADYLKKNSVNGPASITRDLAVNYIAHRVEEGISHNTALGEVRVMVIIMNEAVARGLIPANPLARLNIRKQRVTERPALPDTELDLIERRIADMQPGVKKTRLERSFLVAVFQGCRLNEVNINPTTDVSFAGGVPAVSLRIKGDKVHRTQLHPRLVPLIKELQAAGAVAMFPPLNRGALSALWSKMLNKWGTKSRYPGACFHSFRVTAITRMARASVSEVKTMKFIGHASTTIHRTYQRLRIEDLGDCVSALDRPSSFATTG